MRGVGPIPHQEDRARAGDRSVTSGPVSLRVPCVRGPRIPVATIAGLLAENVTVQEVLEALPRNSPPRMCRACRAHTAGRRPAITPCAADDGTATRAVSHNPTSTRG